jgi:hypothetical protein
MGNYSGLVYLLAQNFLLSVATFVPPIGNFLDGAKSEFFYVSS